MTTAEYLDTLIDCKEDIKSAIIEKGGSPSGGLTTYADAINSIKKIIAVKAVEGVAFGWSNFDALSTTAGNEPLPEIHVDLEDVTDASDMFWASRLEKIYLYNTSNVTNLCNTFNSCQKLTTIDGEFDTSNVTDMSGAFQSCVNLTLPVIDCGSVKTITGTWELKKLSGLKDLGKQSDLTIDSNVFEELDVTSIINIIDTVYNRVAAGYSRITLYINSTTYNELSSAYINRASNKGWDLLSL